MRSRDPLFRLRLVAVVTVGLVVGVSVTGCSTSSSAARSTAGSSTGPFATGSAVTASPGLSGLSSRVLSAGIPGAVWLSPDGRHLAAEHGPEIWIGDAVTGRHLATINTNGAGIKAGAFSPDGGTLAVSHGNGPMSVYEVRTGRRLRELHGLPGTAEAVLVSPDASLVAASDTAEAEPATTLVWDARTGAVRLSLPGAITPVAFTRNASRLTVARYRMGNYASQTELQTWDLRTGALVGRAQAPQDSGGLAQTLVSPDGRLAVTVTALDADVISDVVVFDLGSTRRLCTIPDGGLPSFAGPGEPGGGPAVHGFTPDGLLALRQDPKELSLWDPRNCRRLSALPLPVTYSPVFSPDLATFVDSPPDGPDRLFDTRHGTLLAALPKPDEWSPPVFAPDGRHLFVHLGRDLTMVTVPDVHGNAPARASRS